MPAIYAHEKFGTLVKEQLPIGIQNVINQYPNSYRIGLQGPDYLFFYRSFCKNKLTRKGVYLHHHDIYPFFIHALSVIKKYGTNSSQYSYILGFICHFASDNACHPFVRSYMKTTDCGHAEIEGDLDQLILTDDGYAAERYPLYDLVPTDYDTACSMEAFYEGLTTQRIRKALKWMKFVKRLFVSPTKFKRKVMDIAFHLTFNYKREVGHVLQPEANSKCRRETEDIYKHLIDAVPEAVQLIDSFTSSLKDGNLDPLFHRDFNGKQFNPKNI